VEEKKNVTDVNDFEQRFIIRIGGAATKTSKKKETFSPPVSIIIHSLLAYLAIARNL